MSLCQTSHYLLATSRRLWNDPTLALRKARRVLGMAQPRVASKTHDPTGLSLRLQPGQQVRVKLPAEIRATLDAHNRYEGLHYTSVTMDRYCGGTYTVLTRVDRFFDERSRRILKLKNTVLLDRVYCQPAQIWRIASQAASECAFVSGKKRGWSVLAQARTPPSEADTVEGLRRFGLPIIEDACQAFMARDKRGQGTRHDADRSILAISFHAIKCLTTGEGGVALSDDPDTLEKMRRFRDGVDAGAVARLGSPMTDLQAALGLSQLGRYDSFLRRRRDCGQVS